MASNSITLYTLNLRLKQTMRLLYEMGIFRGLILILIATVLLLALYQHSQDYPYLPICVYGILLFTGQSNRKDKIFLETYIKKSYIIYVVEYACLAVPFVSISFLHKDFSLIICYLPILFLIPLIPNIKARLPKISCSLFTKGSYEYQQLLRKNLAILILFIVVAALGVYNNNEKILYFFAALYSIVCCASMMESENRYYTRFYLTAKHYLINKTISCVYNFSILFIPFFVIGFRFMTIILFIYIASLFSSVILTLSRMIFSENKILTCIYFTCLICPLILLNIVYPITILFSILTLLFVMYKAYNKFNSYQNDQYLFYK